MRAAVRAFYAARPESRSEIAARLQHYANLDQAAREMRERWPVIDGTNADQALRFQAQRIAELSK